MNWTFEKPDLQQHGLKEDILYGHAKNDGLVIERVMANMVSPTEIGCEC